MSLPYWDLDWPRLTLLLFSINLWFLPFSQFSAWVCYWRECQREKQMNQIMTLWHLFTGVHHMEMLSMSSFFWKLVLMWHLQIWKVWFVFHQNSYEFVSSASSYLSLPLDVRLAWFSPNWWPVHLNGKNKW